MASVTLQDVHKKYGKVYAVRGISMEIKNGEFIAFLGPSGCGKSSTMRMIAGLEEITGGDILFDGESIIARKPGQRNVAMAFETYALYPTLTVYENLAFPLRAGNVGQAEVDKRVREVAEIIGITELLDRMPGKLSSGQSQAVGLARALVRKPNVFLLDEPISHLDTSQRFHMRVYIKRLHIDLGYTMILVTHDQEDAMALADRIAVMSDGELHQVDTPHNIYVHPADLFVAGFIGNLPMNFIDGRVISDRGKTYLQHDSIRIEIPESYAKYKQNGSLPDELVLGFRPYHISLDANPSAPGNIPCEIFVVEPLGDMTVASVQLDDIRAQVVTPLSYRAKPGEKVSVSLDSDHLLLFDKKTGKAIQ
jgi:multiple sugar transport system ATP-binding protein